MFALANSAFADDGESGELPARSITGPLIARPCRASSSKPSTCSSDHRLAQLRGTALTATRR